MREKSEEVKRPKDRLNRSLEDRARPANCQRRTLRSRTRWADNVSASTRRTRQPKPTRETWECWSALPAKWSKPAARSPRQLGSNGHLMLPKPRTALALDLKIGRAHV